MTAAVGGSLPLIDTFRNLKRQWSRNEIAHSNLSNDEQAFCPAATSCGLPTPAASRGICLTRNVFRPIMSKETGCELIGRDSASHPPPVCVDRDLPSCSAARLRRLNGTTTTMMHFRAPIFPFAGFYHTSSAVESAPAPLLVGVSDMAAGLRRRRRRRLLRRRPCHLPFSCSSHWGTALAAISPGSVGRSIAMK